MYELHAVDVVTHDAHSARSRSQRARPCTQRAIGAIELSSSPLHYFVHYLSYCSLALFMGTIHGHYSWILSTWVVQIWFLILWDPEKIE